MHPTLQGKIHQIAHRGRWLKQFVTRPELAVIGCYHYSNLGDMTLGETIAFHAEKHGIPAGLQTISNLSLWHESKCGIVGGGAVAYRDSLRQLARRFADRPERLAILAVDFNEPAAIEESAAFLSKVAMITCRGSRQAAEVSRILNRPDIRPCLDLTFASPWSVPRAKAGVEPSRAREGWGFNCPPLFWHFRDGRLVLGNSFVQEMALEHAELPARLSHYADQYIQMFRAICRRAVQDGRRLCHIPFAPEDDQFARLVLKGEAVRFMPYDSNPARAYRLFQSLERFVAGRFHSLAFALQTRTPCLPFCYASKSRRLLEDLGIPQDQFVGVEILGQGDAAGRLLSLDNQCLVLPLAQLQDARQEVEQSIQDAFDALRLT